MKQSVTVLKKRKRIEKVRPRMLKTFLVNDFPVQIMPVYQNVTVYKRLVLVHFMVEKIKIEIKNFLN